MIIREVDEISTKDIQYQDLVFYLSQVVLSRVNDEIERKHNDLIKSKEKLASAKKRLEESKKQLLGLSKELGRVNLLSEVVLLIDTLKKEGKLNGTKKTKILNLLDDLESKDLLQLRSISEKLRVIF